MSGDSQTGDPRFVSIPLGEDDAPQPLGLRLDPAAVSADPNAPPFVARPAGAPVYYGFELIEETRLDGWCFGAITEFEDPDGCTWGDGFVEAPDGSRAGLVWEVESGKEIVEIMPPERDRWGVYQVPFIRPVRNTEDLVANFHAILPQLKELHRRATGSR